jgi:hypothetical protein
VAASSDRNCTTSNVTVFADASTRVRYAAFLPSGTFNPAGGLLDGPPFGVVGLDGLAVSSTSFPCLP